MGTGDMKRLWASVKGESFPLEDVWKDVEESLLRRRNTAETVYLDRIFWENI